MIVKRIVKNIDLQEYIGNGCVETENCSCCWHTDSERNIDVTALRLVH